MIFLIGEKLYETLLTVYNIKFYTKLFVFSCSLTEVIGNTLSKSFGKGGKSPSISEVHILEIFTFLMHLMGFYLMLFDLCLYTLYKCSDLL